MDDVQSNILSRLSVKDLQNYRLVCTDWCHLISTPYFKKMHMRHSLKKPIFMACCDQDVPPSIYAIRGPGDIVETQLPTIGELPFNNFEYEPDVQTVASFNGLLCCMQYAWAEDRIDLDKVEITVFNPCTQRVFMLPKASPCSGYLHIGVGYEPGLPGYRVYRFFGVANAEKGDIACEVYSSSSGTWAQIGIVTRYPMRYHYAYPATYHHVCVKGKVYWFIDSGDGGSPGSILCVDNENNFNVVSLPQESGSHAFLVNFDGRLGLLIEYDNGDLETTAMNIWILEDNGASWSWKCNFKVPFALEEFVLSIAAKQDELFFITSELCGVYNLDQSNWTEYELYNVLPEDNQSCVVFSFTESLLPCNGQCDEEA